MGQKEYSMIDHAIHMAAAFRLENRLGNLRERYMQRVIEGDQPDDTYWETGLDNIMIELNSSLASTNSSNESGNGEALDSQGKISELDQGPQRLTVMAILKTHEKLRNIPFVGQPEYSGE